MQATRKISMWRRFVCCAALPLLVASCSSTGASPLLTADPTGTALFEQGQDALVAQDWRDAINSFDTLLRNYPSSPYLAEARLGLGQAYYEQRRVDSLIMAIDAFQSFLTYHPSHENVDYAQYMVAMTYVAQMRTPDRDQTPTRQAIDALDLFLENYPDSRLYEAAAAKRLEAIDSLARHEYEVARWQAGRDEDWDAAVDRVQFALEAYPETTLKCELLFVMGEAYKQGERNENALEYYERVISEYPDCELAEEARDRVRDLTGG
jgi:outer membrane protein assembly factor BamD